MAIPITMTQTPYQSWWITDNKQSPICSNRAGITKEDLFVIILDLAEVLRKNFSRRLTG
jgi:hypothetical protein